jgi:hypothetical protein
MRKGGGKELPLSHISGIRPLRTASLLEKKTVFFRKLVEMFTGEFAIPEISLSPPNILPLKYSYILHSVAAIWR